MTINLSVAQSRQLDAKKGDVEAPSPFKAYVIGNPNMSLPFILLVKVNHKFCPDASG